MTRPEYDIWSDLVIHYLEKKMNFFSLQVEVFSPTNRKEILLAIFWVLVSAGIIALLSINRNFFTYGVETDYLGGFIKEAQRFMNGEPLHLTFHPPFYSITLALIQSFVQDWFVTGLLISWLSSMIVLCISFVFFYQLFGSYPAWGALASIITSGVFIEHSAQASSDLFFLALYTLCFFFSLQAMRAHSNKYWMITGLIMGFALLTRANSLTLLILIVLPWFQLTSFDFRFKNFVSLIIGLSMPLFLWAIIAIITGSPFSPVEGHLNLALRYYRPDSLGFRGSGDVMSYLRENFQNSFQVLTYNPIHIAKTYIKDLANVSWQIFSHNKLVVFPLNLFALPGIILLCFNSRRFFIFLFIIATLLQISLVNFSTYKIRVFLFLIPVFGAGIGLCIKKIFEEISSQKVKYIILVLICFLIGVGIVGSVPTIHNRLHSQDKEFKEAIPELKKWLTPDSVLAARKPHLPYYVNCQEIGFPLVYTFYDLRENLLTQFQGYPIFLYYGRAEQYSRPELNNLKFPDKSPAWLQPIAKSHTLGGWVLYRFIIR
jgi:hypothetical protein